MLRIIGGILRNRELLCPKGDHTRPTSAQLREALFNICQHDIEGARFLDLFAGTGAIGIEALSRGASHTTFIENHAISYRHIQRNIETFSLQKQSALLRGDVFKHLKLLISQSRQFDIIYADPPYGKSYSLDILDTIDEFPLILAPQGRLFIEDSLLPDKHCKNLVLVKIRTFGKAKLTEFSKQTTI